MSDSCEQRYIKCPDSHLQHIHNLRCNTSLPLKPTAVTLHGRTKHRAHCHGPEIESGRVRTPSVFVARSDIKARLRRRSSGHVTPLTAPYFCDVNKNYFRCSHLFMSRRQLSNSNRSIGLHDGWNDIPRLFMLLALAHVHYKHRFLLLFLPRDVSFYRKSFVCLSVTLTYHGHGHNNLVGLLRK